MQWEELMQHAARSKELRLRSGTVRLHVFKGAWSHGFDSHAGDMPDIHLYNLEREPLAVIHSNPIDFVLFSWMFVDFPQC